MSCAGGGLDGGLCVVQLTNRTPVSVASMETSERIGVLGYLTPGENLRSTNRRTPALFLL